MKTVKDTNIVPILERLPPGYAIVCTRCARRNGLHWSHCSNPAVRTIK